MVPEVYVYAAGGLLVGLLLGGLIFGLLGRKAKAEAVAAENARAERELAWLREQKDAIESRAAELRTALTERTQAATEARIELARLTTAREAEAASAKEKLALLQQSEQRLREEFQRLAGEALSQSNKGFLELAQQNFATIQQRARGELDQRKQAVEGLVAPLKEQLKGVHEQLAALETKREGAYQGLTQQVKQMLDTGQQLQRETTQLVQALRAPQVRGRWGELQLRRAVELAGMLERCDFVEQTSTRDTEGRAQRPDMIVRLPNGRSLIVDAKAPLAAYLDALEAPVEERHTHLVRHARQLRDHVKTLRQKAYWEQFDDAPDFVVLFIPGEVFFSAALEADSALLDDAVADKVIIASPTTLIALLKAVAFGWQQAAVEREARQVVSVAQELYDRLTVVLGKHFGDMRAGLERAVKAYNNAVGSVESRVLPSARKLSQFESLPVEEFPEVKPVEETGLKEPGAAELLDGQRGD